MQHSFTNLSLTDVKKILPKLSDSEKRKFDAELALYEKLKHIS